MKKKFLVGNDLIDLSEPDILKKSKNERFLKRVLSELEYKELKEHRTPHIHFWSLWSAKESAYKILKKVLPELVFSHSKFEVKLSEENIGLVKYKDFSIAVEWFYNESWIHCIATYSPGNAKPTCLKWDVAETSSIDTNQLFSAQEETSIYSEESKAVRKFAKDILSKNSLKDIEIIRFPQGVRFGPPEIWKNGNPLNEWDISMSHDGRYSSVLIAKS